MKKLKKYRTGIKVRRHILIGLCFGRLVVVAPRGTDKRKNALWYCECSCGGATITRTFMLNSGRTQSCGCLQKDIVSVKKPRKIVFEKKCSKCKKTKKATLFGKNITRTDGLRSICKFCNNIVYKQENKGKINAQSAGRKKRIKLATPKWADKKAIEMVYKKAAEMSAVSGKSFHVDHIYPIISNFLCGLHVPWNLQIISASANCSKRNQIILPNEELGKEE